MRVKVEVECTPEEARAFLGLPDVAELNRRIVEEISQRAEANLRLASPDELMKNWLALGGQASSEFLKMLTVAAAPRAKGE